MSNPVIKELQHLINRLCLENESNTPDFILAEYLYACLQAFDKATAKRDVWYGNEFEPGNPMTSGSTLEQINDEIVGMERS